MARDDGRTFSKINQSFYMTSQKFISFPGNFQTSRGVGREHDDTTQSICWNIAATRNA